MLFEQDGYKTFGEKKNMLVSCCKFVTSQALTMGDIFMGWGCMNNSKFWRYSPKCTFQSFVAFLRKDGTNNEEKTLK